MDYNNLKSKLKNILKQENIEADADIDWILVEVTKKKRSMLPFIEFSSQEVDEILRIVELRKTHMPLDYIFGKSEFYGRPFKVTNDTLIPRIDTEVLIETLLRECKINAMTKVIEIGSGSGIIAITIERETGANVLSVDISSDAVFVARENAKMLGSNAKFIVSDLFENVEGKFDLIVSNPPYIKSNQIELLEKEVKDFEPRLALDGGEDGLDFYRKIIDNANDYLNENGMIFFEIGYDQAEDVKYLLEKNFENINIVKDYSNLDRVVYATKRN